MEGNLSRARSSLGHSEGSTPSPQLVTSPNAPSLRISTSTSAPHVSGHARIKSEDGPMGTPKQQSPYGAGITRSASALGAAGGYRQPPTKLKRDDLSSPTGRLSQGISSFPLDTTLESLGEDDTWSNADSMRSGFLSPTGSIYGGDKGLTRSASAAQMRGIQDQMQGLRGKISTLKQQAKADSLKRRSLQSLRTPSPFTHARWDQGLMEPNEIRAGNSRETTPPLPTPDTIKTDGKVDGHGNEAPVTAEAVVANAGTQEDEKTVSSDRRPMSGYSSSSRKTPVQQEGLTPDASHVPQNLEKQQEQDQQLRKQDEAVDINDDDDDDLRTEDGDAYEDAYGPSEYDENDKDDVADDASDWASESGESLYHDTEQFSTSHEDREDAFDYEHFFLHSAMGNMSRHRGEEESSESDFSDASVETTRGPVPVVTPTATLSRAGTAASSRNMSRARRHSGDSNASDETFATANDGRPSRMSVRDSRRGSPVGTAYEELSPLREVRSEDGATSSRLSANDDEERSGLPPPRLQLHRSQYSATSSLLNRPMSASAAHQAGRLHRPSVSSFESTGTTRSFPLVNKSKAAAAAAALGGGGIVASSSSTTAVGGVLTPGGSPSSSSDDGANAPEPALLPKTAMQGLVREDQIAVERLVASLGRVVLGLGDGESSRGGAEYRLLRRRIDAARRMLEGQGDVASP